MVSKLDDSKFLERMTLPLDSEKKDRLKAIFSRMLDQPDTNLLPLLETLKYTHLPLPKEDPLLLGFTTFKATPLKIKRLVLGEDRFNFSLSDPSETTIILMKLYKRDGYLCCEDFYVDGFRDPYDRTGKRPLTELAIRILKEIFLREKKETKLQVVVSSCHAGPVLYAAGFTFPQHAEALKELHEKALKKGGQVAESFEAPDRYLAEITKPIQAEPYLLYGTESLL